MSDCNNKGKSLRSTWMREEKNLRERKKEVTADVKKGKGNAEGSSKKEVSLR